LRNMKRVSNSLKTVVLTGVISFAISILAQAQTSNSDKPAPRRQFGPPAAGRFSPGFEHVLSVLTEEQRSSIREAMASDREKIRDLEQKIRQARKELFELGLREKFDEAAVREKAAAAAKFDAEMTVLRVKAISEIKPPLSAEQIQKIKDSARSELGDRQADAPRRRHDIPRDENGLPLKDQTPAKNAADKP
jgi:Spy/CpxP family protein refolding chaperone